MNSRHTLDLWVCTRPLRGGGAPVCRGGQWVHDENGSSTIIIEADPVPCRLNTDPDTHVNAVIAFLAHALTPADPPLPATAAAVLRPRETGGSPSLAE